jgi:hypothetical protein
MRKSGVPWRSSVASGSRLPTLAGRGRVYLGCVGLNLSQFFLIIGNISPRMPHSHIFIWDGGIVFSFVVQAWSAKFGHPGRCDDTKYDGLLLTLFIERKGAPENGPHVPRRRSSDPRVLILFGLRRSRTRPTILAYEWP